MKIKDRLSLLIAEGEHQQQDFKYEISSVSKIAHSISAFANTEGGRLLVGLRDNGTIAGVQSDEEIYMIDAAAHTHCRPEVDCTWEIVRAEGGHNVLIATIPKVADRPVKAREEDGTWKAYVRVDDQNIVASGVHYRLWLEASNALTFTERHAAALQIISAAGSQGLSLSQFSRRSGMSQRATMHMFVDLLRFVVVRFNYHHRRFFIAALDEQYQGVVVPGHQLGRRLGYPTANLSLTNELSSLPRRGVYAAVATLEDGCHYPAMVNVGYRPTVDASSHRLSVEAHLIGFEGDLYGQQLHLRFVEWIRDERKMESLMDLKSQLEKDCRQTKSKVATALPQLC